MNPDYIAVVINSTIRMTMPVLFVALGSAICNKVNVFNLALEGQMLVGAFSAIAINFFTGSLVLSVLGAALAGMIIALIVAVIQIKFAGQDMVVGTSVNILALGGTSFLLYILFNTKGYFTDPSMSGLTKISIPVIRRIPFLKTIFGDLTFVDYLAIVIAVLMFFYLYKTVSGFRLQSVGINKKAAESCGINGTGIQMAAVLCSGILCGLGGALLTLGQVTLFIENITAGRGFIAMAAAMLGNSHPLGVMAASFFFGFAEAVGTMMQNTAIKGQLTLAFPYIVTIITLVLSSGKVRRRKKVKVYKKV